MMSALSFKIRANPFACVSHHHANSANSLDSPLMQHLLTFSRLAWHLILSPHTSIGLQTLLSCVTVKNPELDSLTISNHYFATIILLN